MISIAFFFGMWFSNQFEFETPDVNFVFRCLFTSLVSKRSFGNSLRRQFIFPILLISHREKKSIRFFRSLFSNKLELSIRYALYGNGRKKEKRKCVYSIVWRFKYWLTLTKCYCNNESLIRSCSVSVAKCNSESV
jgi:hypothetical protein